MTKRVLGLIVGSVGLLACGRVAAADGVPVAAADTASATGSVRTLTLDDCLALGLRQSGTALNAQRDEAIADSQYRQARAIIYPHVALSADYTRLDELQSIDLGESAETFGTLDNYDVTASVSQLLFAGGKVGAALRAARLTQDHAAWRRQDVEAGLVRDLRLAFYRMLLARDALAVREASVVQLTALAAQTAEKAAQGAASEFDRLTVQVRVANERTAQIQARNAYQLTVADFCRRLDVDETMVRFEGELARVPLDGDLDDLTVAALANRPTLRVAALRAALGYEDMCATRAEGWPKVEAFARYNGANAYNFVSFDDRWQWHWSAGLRLSWNLWDGDLTRQATRQKAAEYAKLQTDLHETEKLVALEVRQAYLAKASAEEALAAGLDTIVAAERALEIAQTRHASGLGTYLDVTDANLALGTARLVRRQALHDHAAAVASLRYTCGLDDWREPRHATNRD